MSEGTESMEDGESALERPLDINEFGSILSEYSPMLVSVFEGVEIQNIIEFDTNQLIESEIDMRHLRTLGVITSRNDFITLILSSPDTDTEIQTLKNNANPTAKIALNVSNRLKDTGVQFGKKILIADVSNLGETVPIQTDLKLSNEVKNSFDSIDIFIPERSSGVVILVTSFLRLLSKNVTVTPNPLLYKAAANQAIN